MEWRAVIGYEGLYEVSDTGLVRSLPREVPHYTGRFFRRGGALLKGSFQRYHQVSLSKGGVTRTQRTHVLVAEAFLGPRPEGQVLRHRNGDRSNNGASNLRYGTSQENSDDMREHETVLRGSAHGCSKLSDADVIGLRQLAGSHTYAQLAQMFSISLAQVWNIVSRRQWTHI